MSTTVIDLGEVQPFERFAPVDTLESPYEARDAPLPRSWALLLSAIGLAMLTAGVRMPPQPQEIDRLSLGLGHYQVAAGRVFLLSGIGALTGVAAVDPADGRRLWQADLRDRIDYANVEVAGDVAVISPDPCTSGTVGSLVAIDARTGLEHWRASGVPVHMAAGTPVTVIVRASWSDRCGATIGVNRPLGGELQWEGRDPLTGEVRWGYTVQPGSRVTLNADGSGIRWAAVIDADEHVTIVDLVTGTTSAPAAGLAVPPTDRIAGVGDQFVVSRLPTSDATRDVLVSTYDRRTLTMVWTARVRVADRPVANAFDFYAVVPCGGSVCVVADQTTAIAPDTGTVRWRTARTMYTDSPAGLIADYTWGLSAGGATGLYVHDPETGRRTTRLADWRLLGSDPAGGRLLVGRTVADKTVLAWLPGRGGPQAIGALPAHLESCQILGDRMVCESSVDELWIVRLRR